MNISDLRARIMEAVEQTAQNLGLEPCGAGAFWAKAPDAGRRDIWWVAKTGENLPAVTESASRVVAEQAPQFFSVFSNPKRAHRYFRCWSLTRYLPSAPFNIGMPGSPSHRDLLKLLREYRQIQTV